MRHDHGMAAESSGLGDLKLVGLYDLAKWNNGRRIHLNLGLSIPTGSIDEKSGADILGYGMQLGSFEPGIFILPSLTSDKLIVFVGASKLEAPSESVKTIRTTRLATSFVHPLGSAHNHRLSQ